MTVTNRKEAFILFCGDILFIVGALWFALFIRYASVPSENLFLLHFYPFSFIFSIWVVVFFIAGLYEKHTLLLKTRLPALILNAQITNSVIAIAFFYLAPFFVITPKTNLFLILVTSFIALVIWRLYVVPFLGFRKQQNALLVGSGREMKDLRDEVNNNKSYNITFITSLDLDKIEGIDFKEEILDRVYSNEIYTVVIDLKSDKVEPILPHFYNLIFSKIKFIDMYKVYEDIFNRIPLSLVGYNWFLENISSSSKIFYDIPKRITDIIISGVLVIFSLFLYPFVFIAIKLDDGGDTFNTQERVGKNNQIIKLLKFRTMDFNDNGKWNTGEKNKITKVGAFLRKTRIDELPQLWNVLLGDISLIGPRPEFPEPVKQYEELVPYYNMRYLVKPGLSGWAQMYHENHPHHGIDVHETKMKLSYDLYYIKNRSFLLDLKISLKTIKLLLSQSGV